jgi:hypothetical protein
MEQIFVLFILEFLFISTLETIVAPTDFTNPQEASTSVDAQERGNY